MTAATPTASPAALDDDALVEYGRRAQHDHLSRWGTSGGVGLLFLATAVGLAILLPAQRALSVEALGAAMLCYALAARVRFEYGSIAAVPTEPVFVAMWFLLPPRLLPLVVLASLVVSSLPELARRRMPPDPLVLLAVASWFSVGPALVVFTLAPGAPSWRSAPVYLLALLSQFAADYAASLVCTRAVIGISPWAHLRSCAPGLAVDALLAPLGLLDGFAVYRHPWALLLVLPVLLMFSTFAKERQHRIDNALELSNAYRGTAMLLGDVIEADDAYTGSHSRDVVDLVLAVADRLGLDPAQRRQAEFAALLHDVGKVKIPAEIIGKPGPLDDAEWEIMKTHTVVGETMLEQIGGLLGDVGHVVRSCHERWDGGGYPDGLAGEAIPLTARIVCACDAWSAMRTDRAYRATLPLGVAIEELRACSGTHFDPQVVEALLAAVA